jgi:Spy/CpxP family protein refolding chaperone
MKSKIIILLLIISFGINIGLIVRLAWQRPVLRRFGERDIRQGWRRDGLRHRLDLNENQLKAIEAMHESTFVKMNVIRETLDLKRAALINILKEPQPDSSRIQTIIKEIANLQIQIELGFTKNLLAMKKVLTPEQQEQFFELFKERFGNREMGRFPPEPPRHLKQRPRHGPE